MRLHALILLLTSSVACGAPGESLATESEVRSLEKAAQAGDRPTIARLFAMRSDGAVAEELDIVLGSTITNHPRIFLGEMKKSWRVDCSTCLPGLLGNLGDVFVDRFDAQAVELEKRKRSLASISDKELTTLRDACLRVLDDEIKAAREAEKESAK